MTEKEAERRAAMPWETECSCPLPEEAGFSPQEIWAWEKRLSLGLVADMSEFSDDDGAGCDPNKAENWPETRVLSEKFLRTILFHEPYKSAAARPDVGISCARIPDALDFEGFALDARLLVFQSLFEGEIKFRDLRAKQSINFSGSTFEGAFHADRLTVCGDLYLRSTTFKKDVELLGANVSGTLEADGSTFEGTFEADGLTVGRSLFLRERAKFKKDVRLVGASVSGTLATDGSTFEGAFHADRLTVGGGLYLRKSAKFKKDVRLLGASVGGTLDADGSTFEGTFEANGLTVGGDLYLRGTTFKQDVLLIGAKVGGNLEADGSTFEGTFQADSLTVGGNLFLRAGTTFKKDVVLLGSKTGGDIATVGSTFEGTFQADGLTVGGSLYLRGMKGLGDADILHASVGGVLDLSGSAYYGHLDLTGTTVTGNILLDSSGHEPPIWHEGARLTLRNVTAGALQDSKDAWCRQGGAGKGLVPLDLTGFDYKRLGGLNAAEGENIADRPAAWFITWIESPKNHDKLFNPQPYQHLAATLRAGGQPDKADRVLYAAKNHQLRAGNIGGWTKVKLWVLCGLIGYGYYNYRAFMWFLALVVLGTVLAGYSVDLTAQHAAEADRFWYSFDMALPIVELNAEHKKLIAENWVACYFYVHKMLGFVLASFLVAGLSGLTK